MTVASQTSTVLPRGEVIGQLPNASVDVDAKFFTSPKFGYEPDIVVIEPRALVRDCLVRCLIASGHSDNLSAFGSVDEWLADAPSDSSLVLLCASERKPAEKERDLLLLATVAAKVVLLAEDEEMGNVVAALNGGIKGYIPMSAPFAVAVAAIRLVCAGGIFVPASCLLNRQSSASSEPTKPPNKLPFTSKQLSVIQALQRGMSNKIIAHELDMAEGTVKVHVRNIMRKLKARNRTEVAFLINRIEALDQVA